MFAVPGWSLSADTLKAETLNKKPAPATAPGESGPSTKGTGANATSLFAAPPAKKRKREKAENAVSTGPNVTNANVAELWERVIEGRAPSKRDDKAKRQKKDKKGKGGEESIQAQKAETQANPVSEAVATPTKAPSNDKLAKKAEARVPAVDTTPKPTPKAATPKATPQAQKPAQQNISKKDQKDKPTSAAPAQAQKAEKQAISQQKKFEKVDKAQDVQTTSKVEATKPKFEKNEKSQTNKKNKKSATEKPSAPSPATTAVPTPAKPASALAALLPPAAPKLTPLQASMRAKLVSARFRHLNETLYTSPSEEALRLFSESPDMFQAYHEGFRQQVSVWPENPVDGYVAEIHRRAGKGDKGGKGGRGGRGSRGGRGGGRGGLYHVQRDPTDTLPRTRGHCRLADIGCGDARLAASLAPDAKKIRIEVLSFDLHADPSNPYITAAADASELPITTGTVDVAVFCLALMGTNWLSFIEEAYRILRWKGELWVAEIKSRFAGSGELRARMKQKLKQQQPVSHSVGFRRKNGVKGGKKGQDEEDPDVMAAAMAEVDGDDDNTGATDVTAFVHALRRRGFVLDEIAGGDDGSDSKDKTGGKAPAVDLSNKMFVRMRFVKAAPALVGKVEVMEALAAMNGDKESSKRPKLKYHDDDEKKNADPMDDPALEAKILKPCVYKLR